MTFVILLSVLLLTLASKEFGSEEFPILATLCKAYLLQQVPPRRPPGPAAIVLQARVPQITLRDSVFDTILLDNYHYCLWASSALIINPFLLI